MALFRLVEQEGRVEARNVTARHLLSTAPAGRSIGLFTRSRANTTAEDLAALRRAAKPSVGRIDRRAVATALTVLGFDENVRHVLLAKHDALFLVTGRRIVIAHGRQWSTFDLNVLYRVEVAGGLRGHHLAFVANGRRYKYRLKGHGVTVEAVEAIVERVGRSHSQCCPSTSCCFEPAGSLVGRYAPGRSTAARSNSCHATSGWP